jgi:hypothetical protein
MTIRIPTQTPPVTYRANCPGCNQDCTWTDRVIKTDERGFEVCRVESDGGDCNCTQEAAA